MGLPTGGCVYNNDLPEAADNGLPTDNVLPTGGCLYTLMTYWRPMIMDYLPEAAYTLMTYGRPLIMDYLPEADYTFH